jgi:hypothetical protein
MMPNFNSSLVRSYRRLTVDETARESVLLLV